MGLWWSWLCWWYQQDTEHYLDRITERVAFAARYAHIPLSESLACDTDWLMRFCDKIADFIRAENRRV